MKRFHLQTILLSFLLVSCGGLSPGAQPEAPEFMVITKNPDDQVDIQYENGAAQIDIQSPTGIGSAAFKLVSGTMPETMMLRLHLKGLEELRLTSTQNRISASIPSGEGLNSAHQTHLLSATETPLLPGHPLWMKIEIVSETEKKIPLEEGYFEVTLPQEFIRNAGKMFEIEWIDFYR